MQILNDCWNIRRPKTPINMRRSTGKCNRSIKPRIIGLQCYRTLGYRTAEVTANLFNDLIISREIIKYLRLRRCSHYHNMDPQRGFCTPHLLDSESRQRRLPNVGAAPAKRLRRWPDAAPPFGRRPELSGTALPGRNTTEIMAKSLVPLQISDSE